MTPIGGPGEGTSPWLVGGVFRGGRFRAVRIPGKLERGPGEVRGREGGAAPDEVHLPD